MKFLIKTENATDEGFVHSVCELVLDAYDGRGIEWKHPDRTDLWKINSGGRAGVVGVEMDGRRCCVKLFYDDRLRSALRNALGFSKARRSYENAIKLKSKGIGCPEMIGLAKVGGLCLVVSELCDDAVRTDHYIIKQGASRELVKAFSRFVRAMHDAGIAHVDFSLRNTMVERKEGYSFLLLDYEDVRFGRPLSRKVRIDNLHHMNERAIQLVSLKWRLRFLRAYLDGESMRGWVEDLNNMLTQNPSKYTAS